ncbi:MAG: hypothetical protein H0V88_05720 [Pyrinomonadaceae bacterium]|nr:hypothetical protein [Pyrinomonadaceae bacterium]
MAWSTGHTTTRRGGTWQVGSNTMGGPTSSYRRVFPYGTQPNNSLNRSGISLLFIRKD